MAEAKSQSAWAQTSAILALLANVNRDPKKSHAFKPADFNPHHKLKNERRKPEIKVGIEVLKQVFVDRRPMSQE